jgi:putative transcriptional regulator
MANAAKSKSVSTGATLGRKLLQSVREMQAAQAARVTKVEPNEVAQTGLPSA